MPLPPKRHGHALTGRGRLLQSFNTHFKAAKRAVGHGKTTNNVELEQAMARLGLRPGKVTHECDVRSLKKSGNLPTFVIANIMCEPPGQHWVAYYKGIKYDPLGKDRSGSAEQNDVETNCGQRCLGYLLLCKKQGKAVFL
jgi:hypothetical protein